jgi:hypothetical protein
LRFNPFLEVSFSFNLRPHFYKNYRSIWSNNSDLG